MFTEKVCVSKNKSKIKLTSCSYPPNIYIAFPRTQAEWPSLAPGTVPEVLGVYHLWVSVKQSQLFNIEIGALALHAMENYHTHAGATAFLI